MSRFSPTAFIITVHRLLGYYKFSLLCILKILLWLRLDGGTSDLDEEDAEFTEYVIIFLHTAGDEHNSDGHFPPYN